MARGLAGQGLSVMVCIRVHRINGLAGIPVVFHAHSCPFLEFHPRPNPLPQGRGDIRKGPRRGQGHCVRVSFLDSGFRRNDGRGRYDVGGRNDGPNLKGRHRVGGFQRSGTKPGWATTKERLLHRRQLRYTSICGVSGKQKQWVETAPEARNLELLLAGNSAAVPPGIVPGGFSWWDPAVGQGEKSCRAARMSPVSPALDLHRGGESAPFSASGSSGSID